MPQLPTVRKIHLHQIRKRFGAIQALRGVDFTLETGKVHALLGQNGAGKSTLMNILFGLMRADSGDIRFDDRPVYIDSPRRARELGLGFVQQHFSLVETMTVAENVLLGERLPAVFAPARLARRVQDFIDAHDLNLPAAARISSLSMGERQRVEILKVLYRRARFIIFDEPTSVLAPQEVEALFAHIAALRQAGHGIVFITHKLREALRLSDRIAVLRNGQSVAEFAAAEVREAELARAMFDQAPLAGSTAAPRPPAPGTKAAPLLQVRDMHVRGDTGSLAVKGVSFAVYGGEILGIAGVDGSGQRELADALLGVRALAFGEVHWHLDETSSRQVARQHLGFIPQDRQAEGLVAEFSVAENAVLPRVQEASFRAAGFLSYRKMHRHAESLIREFDLQCQGPQQAVRELSGGNQQKLLVGRELQARPAVVIALNPTWGVDALAMQAIHDKLRYLRTRGSAVLLISTDLDEIYSLCDRFLVLFEGRITGEGTAQTPLQQTGTWMTGGGFSPE